MSDSNSEKKVNDNDINMINYIDINMINYIDEFYNTYSNCSFEDRTNKENIIRNNNDFKIWYENVLCDIQINRRLL